MARLIGPLVGFPGDTARRTTTAELPLGTVAQAEGGKEYVYVQANGAITAKSAVKLAAAAACYDVAYLTNANEVFFGVAEEAFADNEYGWVCVRGVVTVKATDDTAAGVHLVAGTADGVLTTGDATAVAGIRIALALTGGTGTWSTSGLSAYIE